MNIGYIVSFRIRFSVILGFSAAEYLFPKKIAPWRHSRAGAEPHSKQQSLSQLCCLFFLTMI